MSDQETASPMVFRRSAAAMVGGSLGAALGAILFGGFAVVVYAGFLMPDLAVRIVYGSIPGFFAVLMGASAVAAFRRGRDPRVAEVGPDGVWTPEMGLVPWRDLAAVRLESVAGPAGYRNARIRHHRRLGFVPAAGHARPRTAAGLVLAMTQAYWALVRRMAPSADLGTVDLAPYGVSEVELPRDFDRFVEATRQYVEVVGAEATAS